MSRVQYEALVKQAGSLTQRELDILMSRHLEAFSFSPNGDDVDQDDLSKFLALIFIKLGQRVFLDDLEIKQFENLLKLIAYVVSINNSKFCLAQIRAEIIFNKIMLLLFTNHNKHQTIFIDFVSKKALTLTSVLQSTMGINEDFVKEVILLLTCVTDISQRSVSANPYHVVIFLSKLIGQRSSEVNPDLAHSGTCKLIDILKLPGRSWQSRGRDDSVTELDSSPCLSDLVTPLNDVKIWNSELEFAHTVFSTLRYWLQLLANNKVSGIDLPVTERTIRVIKNDVNSFIWTVLDQTECKADKESEFVEAVLLEAVEIATLLCQLETDFISKYLMRFQNLFLNKFCNPVVSTALCTFFLKHCANMGQDSMQFLNVLFTSTLSDNYNNIEFCYIFTQFLTDNLEEMCLKHEATFKYFPNILKLVARWPKIFVNVFKTNLLSSFMSPKTCLELFHCLLDLPCLTAFMELGNMRPLGLQTISELPVNIQPFALFMTRESSGSGDTVEKLGVILEFLSSQRHALLVTECYETAVELLQVFIDYLFELGDALTIRNFLPVILERSMLLFGSQAYQDSVVTCLADFLLRLCAKDPSSVIVFLSEVLEALSQWRKACVCLEVHLNLVWAVGEATSDNDSVHCLVKLYESLECISYELVASKVDVSVMTARYWCCLATSLAKVASSVQDFLPRCVLVLSKLSNYVSTQPSSYDVKCLSRHLDELLCLLRQPTVGPYIISPDRTILSSLSSHYDPQSTFKITRLIARLQ